MVGKAFSRSFVGGIVFSACIALLSLSACQPAANPRRVVISHLDAVLEGDWNKAYDYFSFEDKNTQSIDEYISRYRLTAADSGIAAALRERIAYTAEEIFLAKDSAKISLHITMPEVLVNALTSFMEITSQIRSDSILGTNKTVLYIAEIAGSSLILKEQGHWRVYGNWQKQRETESLLAKKKLDYIERFLKIKNIKIREYQDTQKIQLIATLNNSGGRILTDVEIMVTSYSREGKLCFVMSAHPVSENTKPLQKNSSRRFNVNISSVPADWEKLVEIRIMNCEFGQ